MPEPYYQDEWVTLFHGNCFDEAFLDLWTTAHVLITDPPYGMSYVSSKTTHNRPISGDDSTKDRDRALSLWMTRPAAVFGTWKVPKPDHTVNRLIWDKSDGTGPGMGDLEAAFGNSDEEIYLLGSWPKKGDRRPNVLRTSAGMASLSTKVGHPTPKPIGLMERLVETAPDGIIMDPFAGSGSTLIASKNLCRTAYGIELDERYCEIAAKRLCQEVLAL